MNFTSAFQKCCDAGFTCRNADFSLRDDQVGLEREDASWKAPTLAFLFPGQKTDRRTLGTITSNFAGNLHSSHAEKNYQIKSCSSFSWAVETSLQNNLLPTISSPGETEKVPRGQARLVK